MKRALILLVALSGLLPAQQRSPRTGQAYQKTRLDLNHNGQTQTVGLFCTRSDEEGWDSRLTVWDSQERIRWQSLPSHRGVWAFGGWNWGISDLQLVADVDGDGQVEAISPEPISDVRPVAFRIYRWSGKAFTYVKSAALMADHENHCSWREPLPDTSWIGKLQPGPRATTWTLSSDGQIRTRQADLQADPEGFQILRWIPSH